MPDYDAILAAITVDPRYQRNLAWGEPRSGHPEGTIAAHIHDLEQNLDRLRSKLSGDEIDKLKLLIHVHDTFKPDAAEGVPIRDPRSHASLARAFLAEFLPADDADRAGLLDMVQYHDEPYALFLRARRGKSPPDPARWAALKRTIRDWDLFLAFALIDGSTPGKGQQPLIWLITQLDRDGIATRFGIDDVARLARR
jgi:hypothetical protein